MTEPAWPCLAPHGAGSLLRVLVTPGAPRTRADGLHDGCLRVRLAAPPVDGKANDALLAWLAAELKLPRRQVQLQRGQRARRKLIVLEATPAQIEPWLARTLACVVAPAPPLAR